MNFNDEKNRMSCETCAMGKQARQPFAKSASEAKNLIELIHSDLCGPMETQSIGGAKYILTFVDEYSKKVFVYFLKHKSDVLGKFIEFKVMIECQTERRVKIMRTDNGGEYVNEEFGAFFRANGIIHQLTCPYTPQQNGTAERYNRTIIEKAKCMLFDAKLPKTYWAEAVHMAVYLINRSLSTASSKQTPEELWSGNPVDVSNIRIFGTPVMVHVPKLKRKKLDPKSEKMIFVGFDDSTKGYRCINTSNRKLTISRDVIFLETDSPDCFTIDVENDVDPKNIELDSDSENDPNEEQTPINASPINDSTAASDSSTDVFEDTNEHASDPDYNPEETIPNTMNTPVTTRSRSVRNHQFQFNHLALFTEPSTDTEAINGEDSQHWNKAMQEEIESHKVNGTWTLVELPVGRKAIRNKWVFKIKRDDDGNVIRYKARLVAKGCSQKAGLDYNETFSPVVRYTTIRFLLALAVKNNFRIHQMDAVTAFLQGDLEEEIFMMQPEHFDDGTSKVCKLNRSIYGLKQAGRQWNFKLDAALKKFGLIKSQTDPCIYYTKDKRLIIAIYVDDFLILRMMRIWNI